MYWLDAPDGTWCGQAKGKIRSGVIVKRELGPGLRQGEQRVSGYQVQTPRGRVYKGAGKLAAGASGRAHFRRSIAQAKRACRGQRRRGY